MKVSISSPAIGLVLYCTSVAAQGKCDHYLDEECVDAYGAASFDFQPLFSESPRFAYGFRVEFFSEVGFSSGPPGYKGDRNVVKMWLEYANETIHVDRTANRASVLNMFTTNATGTISGGNNGCDGLLGEECVINLKDILKWTLVLADDYPDDAFLGIQKFQVTPLTNLSCPVDIFEGFPSEFLQLGDYVSEYEQDWPTTIGYRSTPVPSGNASYSPEAWEYRSAEEQMTFAAVGVFARFPPMVPRAYEDIQLELVCVRPEAVEGSSDRINLTTVTENSESEANVAAGLQVFTLLLGTLATIATIFPLL